MVGIYKFVPMVFHRLQCRCLWEMNTIITTTTIIIRAKTLNLLTLFSVIWAPALPVRLLIVQQPQLLFLTLLSIFNARGLVIDLLVPPAGERPRGRHL